MSGIRIMATNIAMYYFIAWYLSYQNKIMIKDELNYTLSNGI